MISFYDWLEYRFSGTEIETPNFSTRKIASNLKPQSEKFNIIPIRLGYDTYKIFKKYSTDNKFKNCDDLLDRRGDSVDWVLVLSSNEELANLKELANFIIKNSNNSIDVDVANSTLNRLSKVKL